MNMLFPEETSYMTRLAAINNPYTPIIKADLLLKTRSVPSMLEIQISLCASPVLYHITRMSNAQSILDSNSFRLSPVGGTPADAEHNKNKLFYMSMSRSKHGKYNKMYSGSVHFVLDGTALAYNYDIHPVDYWGPEFRKHANGEYEMEDRLVSNNPTIPNFSKYIKEIHLAFEKQQGQNQDNTVRKIRRLMITAKKLNLPVFLYSTEKDARMLDKRNAVKNIKEYLAVYAAPEKPWPKADRKNRDGVILRELIYKKSRSELTKDADKFRYNYLTRYREHDFISNLKNEIHNSKAYPSKQISAVVDYMRINKMSPKDLFENLLKKWDGLE